MRKAKFARNLVSGDIIKCQGQRIKIKEILNCDFYLDSYYLKGHCDEDASYIDIEFRSDNDKYGHWKSNIDGGTVDYKEVVSLKQPIFEKVKEKLDGFGEDCKKVIKELGYDGITVKQVGDDVLCSLCRISEDDDIDYDELPIFKYSVESGKYYDFDFQGNFVSGIRDLILGLIKYFEDSDIGIAIDMMRLFVFNEIKVLEDIAIVVNSKGICGLVTGADFAFELEI